MRLSTTTIETFAAVAGIVGATLLATKSDPALGFAAFLASNVGWLAFSRAHKHWRMLVQQLAFLATSLIGLWNWWLGPLLG